MSELELDRVEAGWLVLRGPDDARHRVRLSEELRGAVLADAPAEPGPGDASDEPVAFTPKEIQRRLRRGTAVEEIARLAGVSEDKIRRWEAPVLAERAAAVHRARATRFARPPDGSATGPLGALVDARLKAVGVDGQWDAWRDVDGAWLVQVSHRDGRARWRFDETALQAQDRNAEQLGWAVRPHLVRPTPAAATPVDEPPGNADDSADPPHRASAELDHAALGAPDWDATPAGPPAGERTTERLAAPPERSSQRPRERGRRSPLPSWEDIFDNTPPPNAFPT